MIYHVSIPLLCWLVLLSVWHEVRLYGKNINLAQELACGQVCGEFLDKFFIWMLHCEFCYSWADGPEMYKKVVWASHGGKSCKQHIRTIAQFLLQFLLWISVPNPFVLDEESLKIFQAASAVLYSCWSSSSFSILLHHRVPYLGLLFLFAFTSWPLIWGIFPYAHLAT